MSPSCFKSLIFTWAIIDLVTASANDSPIKCCASNELYDLSERECRMANYTQKFQTFGNLLEFGAPKCDNDSVTVEYDSEKVEIRLEGGVLRLPPQGTLKQSIELRSPSFCVDDVAPTDGSELEGQSHWMARTCQPKSVCDHIPCVRKCCGDGEKLITGGTCGPHSKGIQPKFHHIANEFVEERMAKGSKKTVLVHFTEKSFHRKKKSRTPFDRTVSWPSAV
jgi:hypothetical protein